MTKSFQITPIGIIHSPFKNKNQAPRQGRLSTLESRIEIFPEYEDCLINIQNASHLYIIYFGDRADRTIHSSPTPFCKDPVGVFASRSPNRPNPTALCIVDLIRQEGNTLIVRGLDALDQSPVIDIKIYASSIDCIANQTDVNLPLPKNQ